jgi:hypothetical protein
MIMRNFDDCILNQQLEMLIIAYIGEYWNFSVKP